MNARLLWIALLLAALVACQPAPPPPTPTSTVTVTAAPRATVTPSPTVVPSATATPLRLALPQPGNEPRSSWRPPLYPTPWGLGPYDHFLFARPIAADEINWPLPSYRYGGVFFSPDVPHTGIDIPAKRGTPVLAAGGGTVVWAGWGFYSGNSQDTGDPYGKAVAIRHDFGYDGKPLYTVYGHLDEILVTRGQHVDVGKPIGLVGDTGFTTGPHLHFEVRMGENGFFQTYNPELWLVPPQGWGVLVGSILRNNLQPLRQATLTILNAEGKIWRVQTYGIGTIHSDPYYQENMVLSDLPAGIYQIAMVYEGKTYRGQFTIFPGQVTYLRFEGTRGFTVVPPPTPSWNP